MKQWNKKTGKTAGFTLVEMLIVVAIIAILVAVSIPLVSSSLENARDKTDLANERAAKAEAMMVYLGAASAYTPDGDPVSYTAGAVEAFFYDAESGKLLTDGSKIAPYGKCTKQHGGSTDTDFQFAAGEGPHDADKGVIFVRISQGGSVEFHWTGATTVEDAKGNVSVDSWYNGLTDEEKDFYDRQTEEDKQKIRDTINNNETPDLVDYIDSFADYRDIRPDAGSTDLYDKFTDDLGAADPKNTNIGSKYLGGIEKIGQNPELIKAFEAMLDEYRDTEDEKKLEKSLEIRDWWNKYVPTGSKFSIEKKNEGNFKLLLDLLLE